MTDEILQTFSAKINWQCANISIIGDPNSDLNLNTSNQVLNHKGFIEKVKPKMSSQTNTHTHTRTLLSVGSKARTLFLFIHPQNQEG